MACFVVPAAEAAITSIVTKVIGEKEKTTAELHGNVHGETKLPFSRKLKWLNNMLWGGSALLAFEHLWHGEISAVFPFLTAMSDPAETAEMLGEMATAGVAMSGAVTAVWAVMLAVVSRFEKRKMQSAHECEEQFE